MTVVDPATGRSRFVIVPAAYVFLLREAPGGATEVLLQLRRGTGFMDEHWAAAAAGHVERGETAEAAARREAAEELDVVDLDLRFATAMQRTAHDLPIDERVDFFFTARSWRGTPRIVEPTKCADLRWYALDALPDPVVPHERSVLEGLRRGDLPALSHFGF
ncbi:NUDIX domain-containing protein [Nocardioides sp. zg-536]|uniref:NUDIX domain-containing protein n=1 Tax=Nocardioides faecalis TaxID=2803858 RepID=A0A939BZL2_9ACTN|nr:NUDIX domain-containing protein [Nocardioides faecalis]MBM9461428.1 NUDIX domain-containing protein [Nocardioides faecalis]MBS4751756.1 NUDIX domain-containing protein [Nocardioides faecalis]QVI59382.1 NUDIX domain-containing protein [Nocardioides faecalis]